jgi:glycosyltransferase involved in cell wall biosynthesis
MRSISICIPTYERVDMLFESFDAVKENENISEVVIVDDASKQETWEAVQKRAKGNPKIKLFRNEVNLDCYKNKREAISKSENDWCILLDSDNIINFDYLYRIFQLMDWSDKTIYTPSFASPHFDFRKFEGLLISRENVHQWMDEPMFETMLNAANFFVNKNGYLKTWDGSIDPVTSDSIYMCYKWLEAGNKIQVVEGLNYEHRVHNGSHYKTNVHRTAKGFHESILQKLKAIR